jgi:hypothetical protein
MSATPIRRTKAVTVAAALSALATFGAVAVAGSNAQAIPQAQKSCSLDFRSNAVGMGWTWAGSSVVVKNGSTPRYVVVNFNADANVDSGAASADTGCVRTRSAQRPAW